jgi:hypothetical protein
MTYRQARFLIVLVSLLFIVVFAGQVSSGAEYEYKIQGLKDDALSSEINALGRNGWELVFVRRTLAAGISAPGESLSRSSLQFGVYECIFKRRRGLLARYGLAANARPANHDVKAAKVNCSIMSQAGDLSF